MESVNLFSIPIYKFKFANHTACKPAMMQYLSNIDVYKENTRPGSKLQFTNPNLHKLPEFGDFKTFVNDSLKETMIDLGFVPEIQITGMWATKHSPLGRHHRHTHGNCFLTGVYYLHGNNDTPGTNFYNVHNNQRQIIPKRLKGAPFKIQRFTSTKFEEGTLIIFPPWLEHDTNVTNSDRYIISFNTMPVGFTNHDEFDRFHYLDASDAEMINFRNDRVQ